MKDKIIIDTQTALKKEVKKEQAEQSDYRRFVRIETRLGQNVRWYRKRRRLTQDQLGFLCGLNQNYISSIELGDRNVTLRVLDLLAKGLSVRVEELLK